MNNKNNLKIIILIVVVSIISLIYFILNNNEENYEYIYITNENIEENIDNSYNNGNTNEIEKIKIHIIGEVNKPGIYELSSGARIQDAIIAAGGETEQADLNKVNLAYELKDGQKIYISSIFDEQTAYIYNDGGENVIMENENSSSVTGKININKATSAELQEIKGVGPALADKIVEYREQNGNYKRIEDLKNVSGIGDKKYETIKEYITLK